MTSVKVLSYLQCNFVIALNLDRVFDNLFTQIFPSKGQSSPPNIIPFLSFTSVEFGYSLHNKNIEKTVSKDIYTGNSIVIKQSNKINKNDHYFDIFLILWNSQSIFFIQKTLIIIILMIFFVQLALLDYLNLNIIVIIRYFVMQEQCVALRWGDIVRIHGVNLSKSKNTKGLIISKGFTDTNIYYQTYNQFFNVNFYRESLFQILPRVNFDMHDQLLDQNTNEDIKENLRTRVHSEVAVLEATLDAKSGKEIKYGSQVIFRHVQSKSYVFGMEKAANSGEGAFRIQVSQNLSSFVIFKLVSPRSFENENDRIYYNDALQIYHPKSDSYMNFSQTQQPIYLDMHEQQMPESEEKAEKSIQIKRPKIKKPNDKRTFIMNENKSKCLWKFIEHCSYAEYINKQKIKSHDIVYFKHTKKGEESLISTSISEPIKCYLKMNISGNLSYECFWELIPKEVNEFGPEECNLFWARNIVTGQLLQFNNFQVQITPSGKVEGKGFDNRGLINLICSEAEQQTPAKKLELGLEMTEYKKDLTQIEGFYEAKSRKFSLQDVETLPKDIFMIYKLDEEILHDAMYVISAHQCLIKLVQKLSSGLKQFYHPDENQFYTKLFQKFQEEELGNIVTIEKMLAGKIYGTDYDNIIASGNTPNKTVQQILVESGIVQILIEILNSLYQPFRFIEKNNDKPSDDRAIRMKITQIFQFTYKLIEKIASNFEENRIYISRWVDMFLEHSNNVNKSYIQECLVGILRDNPMAIRATITEEKIKNLIANFFSEANETRDAVLTTKYLRIFSTFIVCENSVIKQNQNIILQNFFKNPKNQYNFRFKVQQKFEGALEQQSDPYKVKTKQMNVSLGRQPFIPLATFFETNKNKWNYLMAYINLLADICKDRNTVAIEHVSSILSLQAVAIVLFSNQTGTINETIKQQNSASSQKIYTIENVHEPFIRIAHHVYVDGNKFEEIKRIKRISQWYSNQERARELQYTIGVEEINKTKRKFQGEKEEEQKNYLQSILEYIKNYVRGCNLKNQNLNMLNIVLSLLKSTVILGLWKSIKSFRQIAPDLMLKITKVENTFFFQQKQNGGSSKTKTITDIVSINKQRLKMNRPEIALAIQCKVKAIQIFKYMYDLEIDIRLRYMMNFFKGLYLVTENFNQYDNPLNDKAKEGADDDEIKRNQFAEGEYFKMEGKALLGDSSKKMPDDVDIILKQNVWLNKLNELTPFKYDIERRQDPMKDRYMFQGDISEIETKDLEKQFNTIVLGLFELAVYQDYKILNSSINMLRIMFEQRKDLINNFKKNMICGKGNLKQVYLTLKFMRGKFGMLVNSNIKNYVGDADKSFPFQIKKPYDYLIKDREKRSGIIQDLFFLTRTLKQGTSLKNIESLMWVDEEFFSAQVYNFINQKQRNNPLFQSLNLAQGIYIPLFQYIKLIDGSEPIQKNHQKLLLSIYQYLTLLCFNNLQAKQILMPYIPYILPHLKEKVGAASFLYEVTTNNKLLVSNEQLVSLIIEKCLESCLHLERNYAVLDHLLKNFFFAEGLSKSNQDVSNNDYQRSRILYALRGVLIYNNQGHKKNQQLLMNRLQDNKFNRLIFQGTIQCTEKQKTFILSGQQTYIVYAFELFSVLVESGNMINIGKLENLHPYEYCLECLEGTTRWEVRRALRAYINRLYYVNKDKDIFLFEKFISRQFTILNKELKDLVQLHINKGISEKLKIKNGIRFSYAQSIIFLFIIECLITLHEMFLKPGFITILRRQLAKDEKNKQNKKLHDSFIDLFTNLGCINRIYQGVKIISPFMNQVKRLMMIQLERMPVRYLQKKSEPVEKPKSQQQAQDPSNNLASNKQVLNNTGEMQKKNYMYDQSKTFFRNLSIMLKFLKQKEHMDKLKQEYQKSKKQVNVPQKQLKQRYLETIFKVQHEKSLKPYYSKKAQNKITHFDPHLQTANSRIFKVLAKPELQQDKENVELNNNLQQVKNMIEDSAVFDKFKDDQFIFFVNTATVLDQTSTQQYADQWIQYGEEPKPVISLNEVFTKIFKLIKENPDKIDDQQKIFVIKMVRCYITESVEGKQSYKLPVDKWDADYCEGNDSLNQRQEKIQACGGSDFIISIFKQNLTGRIELLNEVLLLGIAYLFGGNHNCQNSILSCLKKDPENVMMINMKNLIKNIGEFLINVRKIKQNEKKRNFAYNIVDTYDYFNPEDRMICKYFSQSKIDKFEVQTELDNEKALCRIFRFLQLFCQNNNVDMKRFLSLQSNQDDQAKTNTINFVEEACNLLKKLFKIMNSKLVMIPNNLLAFVGEVTQVPIIGNQISFIKSTFFEDISYMASFFDSPENKLQRKFNLSPQGEDDPLNTLSQIYRQAIGLALGNFEGNQQIIIKQFLNKCQSKLMWLIIRDELWSLIKQKYTKLKFYVSDENQNQIESRRKTFKNLDFLAIKEIIKEQKKNTDFDGPIISIIQVLIILRKIQDFAQVKQKSALADRQNPNLQDSADAKKARDFKQKIIQIAKDEEEYMYMRELLVQLDNLILGIEVLCENGKAQKLQYIYFPKHPVFEYLADTTKDSIMVGVVRDTSRDKLVSLLSYRQEVYNEIKWNYKMNFNTIKGRPFPITSNLCESLRKTANYCSYLVIFLMFFLIIAEHEVFDEPTTFFTYENKRQKLVLKMVSFIQLIVMFMYAGLWYILRGQLIFNKYLKSLESQESEGGEQAKTEVEATNQEQPLNFKIIPESFIEQRIKQSEDEALSKYKKIGLVVLTKVLLAINWVLSFVGSFDKVQYLFKVLINAYKKVYNSIWLRIVALFSQSEFKSIMFFLITSILGNFGRVQWYTTHLFSVFVGVPQLINVFKAIVQKINTLLILSLLVTAFTVVFNILSLPTYVPVIWEDQIPEEACSSVKNCILEVYTSGAIGDDMDSFELSRFIFDLIYVVFIELLFQNLVGGIIIDAYGSLTEQDNKRQEDKKGKCYICSMTKSNIEKQGLTFKKHTDKHFLWNYLYYIYCLESKDETDYTGIQYIITNKIAEEDVSWFPQVAEEDNGGELETLMNQLKDKLKLMKDHQMKIVSKVDAGYEESLKKIKKCQILKAPAENMMIMAEGEN